MSQLLLDNFTRMPNKILDEWMADLSGAEFKVVNYIARRTLGFDKLEDSISINQMVRGIIKRDGTVLDRGTGLSRSAVKSACASLERRGYIQRERALCAYGIEYAESTYWLHLERTSDEARRLSNSPRPETNQVVGPDSTGRPETGWGEGQIQPGSGPEISRG